MGFSSREIGDKLFISPKTAETHRQRAMEKLGLERRSDLIKFAVRAGILDTYKRISSVSEDAARETRVSDRPEPALSVRKTTTTNILFPLPLRRWHI